MFDADFVVVGSGFGGSVAGLRLVEKGYRVILLEQGREQSARSLPASNWDLRRWMWLPRLGLRGFFSMRFLRHITVLHGVAVGGGSITYAATLPMPPAMFFSSGDWAGLLDWEQELAPHYATARRMLGVAVNCAGRGRSRPAAGRAGARPRGSLPGHAGWDIFRQTRRDGPGPLF
jgi:cholesterol oxidase